MSEVTNRVAALKLVPMLKALIAPYGGVRSMPTGGINQANMSLVS